jgi:serine/threonine-protein kinase
MDVGPGSSLGAYQISALIGEGGMGTVYRAHDPRLGRDVAIKVVRSDLALDPERLARFDREARLLASLSHPHIATVYGFEQAGNIRFLVMELVAGVSLADRVAEGPLPIDESLALAAQIAAAMEAAHERGIIHRDLKPSNITLTTGGAKVLDFGLAKALAGDSASHAIERSPTLTSGGTGEGVILGTAAFMSPEQARGKPVDRRTDVWAFGCVLFDMLTGRSAFAGDTLSDTIANILTRDPDWSALPAAVPPSIRRLLRRCLEKDPSRRLRDMGDARLEIDDALARRDGSAGSQPVPSRKRAILHALAWSALGAVLAAVAATLLIREPEAPPASPVRFTVTLPDPQRLSALDFPAVAISPSGSHISCVVSVGGPPQLLVRALADQQAVPLAGTNGAFGPFFSPDGQWIAFFADGQLKKVPTQGGPVRTIASAPLGFGGVWAPDGTIVFAPTNASALSRVSSEGGTVTGATALDTSRGEFSHRWPELSSDGKAVLFTSGAEGSWDDAEIVVQPLDGGARQVVIRGGNSPRLLGEGHLAYAHAGSIMVAAIDQRSWRVAGDAAKAVDGVAHSVDGAAQFDVSGSGTLVYVRGTARAKGRRFVWVDRQGAPQPLPAPPKAYGSPRLSPDGRFLALTIAGERDEIALYEIARNALTQLTYEGGAAPVWTPDGSRLVYSAGRGAPADLFWRRLGDGTDERLNRSPSVEVAHSISPDGRWLAFVEYDSSGNRNISLMSMDDRSVRPFLATGAVETAPAFSPDGRSLAYVSDVSGSSEVYVSPVADSARPVQVSSGGGYEPVWNRAGPELFYRAGDRLMAASVRPNLSIEPPRMLFRGAFETGVDGRPAYDVSADGARFLMIVPGEDEGPPRSLHIVLGWTGGVAPR